MSTIKNSYDNVESIPEGMESIYSKQENGTYQVQVEGLVDKSRVTEFRDNNINLRKELEGAEETIKGMRDEIEGLADKAASVSVEATDKRWSAKLDTAVLEKDAVISGLRKENYDLTVGTLISDFTGKNIIAEGQAHFNEIISGKVEPSSDGSTYMIGDETLNTHLNEAHKNPAYAIFFAKADSTGGGIRSDSTGNAPVAKVEYTTHETLLAGLKALKGS